MSSKPPWAKPQVGDEFAAPAGIRAKCAAFRSPWETRTTSIFVKEFSSDWQTEAAEIGRQPRFKQGVNVELVIVKDKSNVEVRFFERGVGETQSSGTGSCASAVAAIADKTRPVAGAGSRPRRSADRPMGGGRFFFAGPAQLVCRGEFFV